MCLSTKEWEELNAMGKERWRKVRATRLEHLERLQAQIRKMQDEEEDIEDMSEEEYEKKYLAPPEEVVASHKFSGVALAEVVSKKDSVRGAKPVFLDLATDEHGTLHLVEMDKSGAIKEKLLTFAPDGVVDRHKDLSLCSLALGRDKSLRGRIVSAKH